MAGFFEGKVTDFLSRNSQVLDDYFQGSFGESAVGPKIGITHNPYAMIALGGYGRQEQCVHSDIDLLFLFQKKIPKEAEALIKEVVYPLWDLGFEIGYAVRSLKECISLAAKDLEVLTSVLDARFLCGASFVYSDLMNQIRTKVILKKPRKIIEKLLDLNQLRHDRFGDSAYLLEPNLKEGQGGIRDYHTMLWIAKIESNIRRPRDLERYGYLTHGAFEDLISSLHFIWDVRNRLHVSAGRKCDQLHLTYQTELAEKMNFVQDNGQRPVEKFLGKLHGKMETIKQQYLLFLLERGLPKKSKRKTNDNIETVIAGLEVHQGMLFFKSSDGILKSPEQLMNIFKESLRLKLPLSGEAKQLVSDFSYLVDDKFRKDPVIFEAFEKILTALSGQFNVLSEMLETGFLAHFIPPFKAVVNRIQYDEYHLYPVDRHSLLTVRIAKDFRKKEMSREVPLCHEIFRSLPNKKQLLWATLLHDIGKGEKGGNHSKKGAEIALSLLKEFGLREKDVDTICFLIEEHLLLAKTATRRDINDEETAIFCARRVKEKGRLKMLYLLTVADSMATGPKAWNEWTAALLRSFFLKVLNVIEKGELASSKAIKNVEQKKETVLASLSFPEDKKNVPVLLDAMSPRYILYASSREMLEHIRLYQSLETKSFAWDISGSPDSQTRTVTICALDRPGLFSKIAGTFTLNGLNILDCRIFTWRNNIALDIFEVEAPPDQLFENERWKRVMNSLDSALTGKKDLAAAVRQKMATFTVAPGLSERPNQVIIDNDSSSFFTIVEVFTYDFPGLLFSVTDALFQCGLDIWVAKIATKVDQVVDVFYVRDFDGQKVDTSEQEDSICQAISAVLPKGLNKKTAAV